MFRKDADEVYRCAFLLALPWLEHGFGTRQAGVWTAWPLATLRQVHSNRYLYVAGRAGRVGEGDALLTDQPGLMLGVWTADCVPVLLADRARRAVAAVHAGWRGVVLGLISEVVSAMRERFGSTAQDLVAALGPAICGRCYVVGPEVSGLFQRWFPERDDLTRQTTIDLREACRRQLIECGLPPAQIAVSDLCTSCRPEEFFSYRRDREPAARMLSAIGIRP